MSPAGNTGCSGLVAPAGGRLVDLSAVGAEHRRLTAAAADLPRVVLDAESALDLTLLATGAYSPLDRFMGAAERRRVITERRLADGTFFPAPVTLPVRREEAAAAAVGSVALAGEDGTLLAVLEVEETYAAGGRHHLAGRPRVLETPVDPRWRRLHWHPRETRECLDRFGRSAVVACEQLDAGTARRALDLDAVLLVQPPAELGEPFFEERLGPLEEAVRARRGEACLAVLPWPRGGDDPLLRALVYRNFGASHLLAPPSWNGTRELVARFAGELGITPLTPEAS